MRMLMILLSLCSPASVDGPGGSIDLLGIFTTKETNEFADILWFAKSS